MAREGLSPNRSLVIILGKKWYGVKQIGIEKSWLQWGEGTGKKKKENLRDQSIQL